MLSGIVLSVALSAVAVPPGASTADHSQPYHSAALTVRRFERKPVDTARKLAWHAYVQELDQLWLEYRASGSTPAAFSVYRQAASDAKQRYVWGDPYLLPILP